MTRALVTFALIGVPFLLAGWGMWRGYTAHRSRDERALAPLPTVARPDRPPDATARYTGTTRDGNWVERVAAGGLFGRGPCALWVDADGLIFQRHRAPVVRAAPIVAVNLERAHAGQLAPPGRLVVVRWRHHRTDGTPVDLDSGFLTRSRDDARRLIAGVGQEVGRRPLRPARAGPAVSEGRPVNGPDALVVLEDGTAFRGTSFGAPGTAFGEAVFNTGMAGYQEVLTDPSYRGQVVVMTAPHVGNYGMNHADAESDRIQVAGFVVREAARRASSWRAESDLRTALQGGGVVAVEGVDTRRLTRHVRELGAMRCGVSTELLGVDALLEQVLRSPQMVGRDLAREAGTPVAYDVAAEAMQHGGVGVPAKAMGHAGVGVPAETIEHGGVGSARFRVVALDCGMKRSILRSLTSHGIHTRVVPATTPAAEILTHDPDGVFVSNGPGDPAAVTYGIDTLRALLGRVPVFGICLGSQLLGHALGADTYKLRFGHRGVNQPVLRRADGAVEITSHNHGFAVDAATLGEQVGEQRYLTADHGEVEVSHLNLNDLTCEGLVCLDLPAFSVQYHPEAAPGPHDATYLFERFARLMEGARTPG